MYLSYMKIIISEDQEEKIKKVLEKNLSIYFSDLDSVCEFRVYINEPEDYQLSDYRFDVYVVLKKSYVVRFNHLGQANLSSKVIHKVSNFIKDNFPFKCYVGTYTEEC